MTALLNVNQALANLSGLENTDVTVEGILHFEFEDVAIYHWPKSERFPNYGSGIWLSVGMGSFNFDVEICRQLNGKRVVVEGLILKPDAHFGGCGHMNMWPAELIARTLSKVSE